MDFATNAVKTFNALKDNPLFRNVYLDINAHRAIVTFDFSTANYSRIVLKEDSIDVWTISSMETAAISYTSFEEFVSANALIFSNGGK